MSTVLTTERLLLRPLKAADISHFLPLISDFGVARNLSRVPHPYTEDAACAFVVAAANGWRTREDCIFAIVRKADGVFLGAGGVHPAREFEIGYWLGKPFWKKGYATEAAACLVTFAFDELKDERLTACWFHDNPASGRVLEKLGFTPVERGHRPCLARGGSVPIYLVALDRKAYMTRKNGL